MARTFYRIRNIFYGMKARCYKESASRYNYYGAKGITICDSWLKDINEFIKWSIDNGYNDTLSIDRVDVKLGYSPENCRWVNMSTQAQNRGVPCTNTSSYIGVSFNRTVNKWRVLLVNNKKRYYLGVYQDIMEAVTVYDTFIVTNSLLNTLNFPEQTSEYLTSTLAKELTLSNYKSYVSARRWYIGVTQNGKNGYSATIRHNNLIVRLGTFKTPEEAARKYDSYIKEHSMVKELNFPDYGEEP